MSSVLDNELFDVFAASSGHVFINEFDLNSDLSRWSQSAVDYFNLPGEYIHDAMKIWRPLIHPDDLDLFDKSFIPIQEGTSMEHICQYRIRNKNGNYTWIECNGHVTENKEKGTRLFASIITKLDNQNKYDPLTHVFTIHELNNFNFSIDKGIAMIIGIDSFRSLLNTYGYAMGNKVLVELAQQMLTIFSPQGFKIYRILRDEFIIVMPNESCKNANEHFKRITEILKGLPKALNHQFTLNVSAGFICYPADGSEKNEILQNLEHSLEHAKKEARGQLVQFSSQIASMHQRANSIKEELTQSINNNYENFELYFQPIVDAKTHKLSSCEALLRWQTPTLGVVRPAEFIVALENSGQICQVGKWVLDQALLHLKKWQVYTTELNIGCNVSYIQMRDDTFIQYAVEKVKEYGIEPSRLVIELTESCKVEVPEYLAKQFEWLNMHGIHVALDDFGIAYSSLGMLRSITADYVKIDHSFICELAKENNNVDLAIIECIVSLCRNLNMKIVAEGVENQDVVNILDAFPIDCYQGYYYSKPLSCHDFEEQWLKPQCQVVA